MNFVLLRRQEPSPHGTTGFLPSQEHGNAQCMNKAGYVYLMASGRNGTLYLGVTSDLVRRSWQHRNGFGGEFSLRYRCHFLVWFEAHDDLQEARLRELQIKKWKRARKLRLIEESNADWRDLFHEIAT